MAKFSGLKRTLVIVPKIDLASYGLRSMLTSLEITNNGNSSKHPRYIASLRAPYFTNTKFWWPTAPYKEVSEGGLEKYEEKYLTIAQTNRVEQFPTKANYNREQPNVNGLLTVQNFRILASITRIADPQLSSELLMACSVPSRRNTFTADLYFRKSHGVIINDVEVTHKQLLTQICDRLQKKHNKSRICPETDVLFHFYNPVFAYQHPGIDSTGERYKHELFESKTIAPEYVPNPAHSKLLEGYTKQNLNPLLERYCENIKGKRNLHIPVKNSRELEYCRIKNSTLSIFVDDMCLINDVTKDTSSTFRRYLNNLIPFMHNPETMETFPMRALLQSVYNDAIDKTDEVRDPSKIPHPNMPTRNLCPTQWNSDVITILKPAIGLAGTYDNIHNFIFSKRHRPMTPYYDHTITVLDDMLNGMDMHRSFYDLL